MSKPEANVSCTQLLSQNRERLPIQRAAVHGVSPGTVQDCMVGASADAASDMATAGHARGLSSAYSSP